jgi:general secretion pathway protein D
MIRSPKMALLLLLAVPLVAAAAEPAPACATGADPEIGVILEKFSKRTGRKLIVDPRVRAIPGFYGIKADEMTYEQLLATLTVNQFVAVNQGDVTIIVPDANARQMPTPVYLDTKFTAADDEWVTLVLTTRNACAAHLVPILRPLMPQAAHMAAYPTGNTLIVSDRSVNAKRIATLVAKIDAESPANRGCDAGGSKSKE